MTGTAPLEARLTSTLGAGEAAAYDRFVDDAAGGHFAQARAWAKVVCAGRRCRVQYFMARDDGGVVGTALVLRPTLGPLMLPSAMVERGPVCARVEDLPRVLVALRRAARRRGIGRLAVMPYWAGESAAMAEQTLARHGFRDVQALDGAHASTLRLDLVAKHDQAAICAGSKGSNLRHRLRSAERAGALVRRGDAADIAIFEQLYREVMDPQNRSMKPKAWFTALGELIREGSRAALFLCEHDKAPIGAAYVCRLGTTATLSFAATTSAPRPISKLVLPLMAAIRWARDEGCTVFDLGGVPMDGDPDTKRRDITTFKLHFARERLRLTHEHARWF